MPRVTGSVNLWYSAVKHGTRTFLAMSSFTFIMANRGAIESWYQLQPYVSNLGYIVQVRLKTREITACSHNPKNFDFVVDDVVVNNITDLWPTKISTSTYFDFWRPNRILSSSSVKLQRAKVQLNEGLALHLSLLKLYWLKYLWMIHSKYCYAFVPTPIVLWKWSLHILFAGYKSAPTHTTSTCIYIEGQH